jgi:hypothetical protein
MSYFGPLGHGWDHNYNRRVVKHCDGSIVLWDGSLRTVRFEPVGGFDANNVRHFKRTPGRALDLVETRSQQTLPSIGT